MKPAFAVSAISAVVSFLPLYADARPFDHKIHHLRNEIIALDASLITAMSQAENSIGDDVELLHASIVAAQVDTVDTAAAYREAKSLIDDLDALRQHAIADLTLPSGFTPPDVVSTAALASGATSGPDSVLASTYADSSSIQGLIAVIQDSTLNIEKKLKTLAAHNENISIGNLFEMQMLMNQLSQLSEMTSSITSATNSAIASMARNVKG
jgi:Family of unknown function (DUF5407)